MSSPLQENRDAVLGRIAAACASSGRSREEVRLLAVTKAVPAETARALADLGQLDLGENRVGGLEEKTAAFAAGPGAPPVRWHFIGHLQRNKARRVARLAHAIHSVDSEDLLAALGRISGEEGVRPGIYLQVNVAGEEQKHGFTPDAAPAAVERARETGLPLLGLMTMAPLVAGDEARARSAARRAFERLAALAGRLPGEAFAGGRPELSMGMSGDLEEAVAAGAHWVRIGTALFAGVEPAGTGGASSARRTIGGGAGSDA